MGFLDGMQHAVDPFEALNSASAFAHETGHLGGGGAMPSNGNGTTASGAAPFAGMFDGPLPGYGGLGPVTLPNNTPLQPAPMGPIQWTPHTATPPAHPPHRPHHHHHHHHTPQPDMVFTESEVDPSRARPGVPDMVFTESEVAQYDRQARGGR